MSPKDPDTEIGKLLSGPWARSVDRSDRMGAEKMAEVANLPNAVTLASLGLGLWWVAGGPSWAALASIMGDEIDGRLARKLGQTSDFGADFDWGSDMVLTPLALRRVGAPWWTLLASTVGQVWFRSELGRPPIGSVRAAVMLYGVVREEVTRREIGGETNYTGFWHRAKTKTKAKTKAKAKVKAKAKAKA